MGIAAILVAGGFSTRMKRWKPLLPLAGTTVVEHALAAFGDTEIDERIVVLGHRADELAPVVQRAGARAVVNPSFDQGMYTSVVAGVQALAPSVRAAFVLPADMPAVKRRTVALLARTWQQTGADVIYPSFSGERGHPPLISARVFPEILRGDGRGGLRRVLAAHEGRAIELNVLDEGVVIDLDTPADYQRAEEICRDRSLPTVAECEALLTSLRVHRGVVLHGRAVARVAIWLADRLGPPLNARLLEGAARLHDLAKGTPDHARSGARLLEGLGYRRVAALVAFHMDLAVGDTVSLDEAALLYLADKLVRGQSLVGIEERFSSAEDKFRGDPAALHAAARRRAAAYAIAAEVGRRLGPTWWDTLRHEVQPATQPDIQPDAEAAIHA